MANPFTSAEWGRLATIAERVETLDGREVTRLLFANGLGLSIAFNDFVQKSADTAELAALKHGDIVHGPRFGDVIPWATYSDAMEAAEYLRNADPADFSRDYGWDDEEGDD